MKRGETQKQAQKKNKSITSKQETQYLLTLNASQCSVNARLTGQWTLTVSSHLQSTERGQPMFMDDAPKGGRRLRWFGREDPD